MEQSVVKNRLGNSVKAFLFTLVIFCALVLLIGVLLRFTPLPERFTSAYMLTALSVACLFLGLSAGNAMKRRGYLYGALFSVIFLLCVISGAMYLAGSPMRLEMTQLKYGVCILCGAAGGMVGVNVRG